MKMEFLTDVLAVGNYGGEGNEEPFSYLFIDETANDKGEDFGFAFADFG